MVNLQLFKKFRMEKINFAICILFSIFSVTCIIFTGVFIYPNLETLLLVAIFSSFFGSIDLYFFITFSHNSTLIKQNRFPKYGIFLSKKYWSGVENEFYWIVIPTSLFFVFLSLFFAFYPDWHKINLLFNNEFIFLISLLFSIFFHIFFYFLSRQRVRKFLLSN